MAKWRGRKRFLVPITCLRSNTHSSTDSTEPQEEQGWEGWNQYFLQQIIRAAKQNPGKRIVVIVGVEHGYWLREHLRKQDGVKLLDTVESLQH